MQIFHYILTFLKDFVQILGEMAPYLLLGFFFAGLLHAFIPQHKIEKYFSGNPFLSSLRAAFLGVPLPLCSCGVIPTGTALYKNGASKGGTVSFLISTPQTGVDSILATFSLMGLPFAIIRPIAALITGVTGGFITGVVTKNETATNTFDPSMNRKKSLGEKVKDVFQYGFVEFIQDISKWLVIGLVLAAVISALIPENFFEMLNLPPILQMLMILVVSVPLYICATGSIPLAAVLILKGISPGAAFVLLMAGPATNAATITMIGKVLGKKSLFMYLSTIIIGALGFGLLIDYALPTEWFTSMLNEHAGHVHDMPLNWIQITSAIALTAMIVNGYIQRYYPSKKKTQAPTPAPQMAATAASAPLFKMNTKTNMNPIQFKMMQTEIVKVDGMTCNHCKANVENNLQKLDFVDKAVVNLADKTVTLEGSNIKVEKVKETISSLGYTPM